MRRVASDRIDFDFRPSVLEGASLLISVPDSTPEGFTSTVNWGAARDCARESDVVVLFGLQGGTALAAAALARFRGRPVVSVNQTLPPGAERRRRWWVRLLKGWLLHRCIVHVVQTPVSRDTLRDIYGLDPATFIEAPFESGASVFRALYAGVTESRDTIRRSFGWPSDACVFLFVGNMVRFKGVETLLDAAAILKTRTDAGFRVTFLGPESNAPGEPRLDDHRARAVAAGHADTVEIVGNCTLPDLARAYRAADALLLPTRKDCWPKVLVEAALAGLPLVTTDTCGAAGSLVRNGETGLVVPPGDPAALADAMERLLDPTLRARLGAAARAFVDAFCDPVREVDGYIRAVDMALAGRRPESP
jgi:glycosyltransferase involved in cell wall biosynthesis